MGRTGTACGVDGGAPAVLPGPVESGMVIPRTMGCRGIGRAEWGQGDTERPRINHPETGARGQGEGGAVRTERSWTDGRGSVREET